MLHVGNGILGMFIIYVSVLFMLQTKTYAQNRGSARFWRADYGANALRLDASVEIVKK